MTTTTTTTDAHPANEANNADDDDDGNDVQFIQFSTSATAPPLRKRARGDSKTLAASSSPTGSKRSRVVLSVQATAVKHATSGTALPLGPVRVRELVDAAVTSLFGEEGARERFRWTVLGSDAIALETGRRDDIVAFRAALALMQGDLGDGQGQGRIRVLHVRHDEGISS